MLNFDIFILLFSGLNLAVLFISVYQKYSYSQCSLNALYVFYFHTNSFRLMCIVFTF